jgi:hypothetical protein
MEAALLLLLSAATSSCCMLLLQTRPSHKGFALLSAGVCPPVPQHLQLNFPNHMQLAQQALSDRFGLIDHIHYKSQPPRPLLEVKKWSLQTLDGWKQQQQQLYSPSGSCERHPRLQQEAQPCTEHVAAASRPCAESCPRFCDAALQDLSLSLGVAGLGLVRLLLDHTLLGDSGISQLATGLGKCSSLRQLSLCYCNIGPAGIKDLAAALDCGNSSSSCTGFGRSSAASAPPPGSSRLSSASNRPASREGHQNSSSAGPKLQQLLLSGNPLAGFGLQHLTPALICMQDLQVSQTQACFRQTSVCCCQLWHSHLYCVEYSSLFGEHTVQLKHNVMRHAGHHKKLFLVSDVHGMLACCWLTGACPGRHWGRGGGQSAAAGPGACADCWARAAGAAGL